MRRTVRIVRVILYKETDVNIREHLWTFLGAFLGIGLIGYLNTLQFALHDNLFLIGSFGASSVLIYGIPGSPLAQPRNVVGGHFISACIGVIVYKLFPDLIWLSSALAVSLSIIAMQATKTLHPPGGATALIASIGTVKIKSLGFLYPLSPVLSGSLILLLIAILINRLSNYRAYPANPNWYQVWKRKYF